VQRRSPLAAARRYYPGFFAALFIVLLRMAIGWHFLYEGVYKINTTPSQRDSLAGRVLTKILSAPHDKDKDKDPPFSAEGYLRNATGPLAPRFRAMVPDVDSLEALERDAKGLPTRLKNTWRAELNRIANHYLQGRPGAGRPEGAGLFVREARRLVPRPGERPKDPQV